jgi:hypothetical protein
VFHTHRDARVLDFCRQNHIKLCFVPANTTSHLQVCDVSINKPWKAAIAKKFSQFVCDRFQDVSLVLEDGSLDMNAFHGAFTVGHLRDLALDCTLAAYDRIRGSDFIRRGIEKIGLSTVRDPAWEAILGELDRQGLLWKSFTRNDIVLMNGTRTGNAAVVGVHDGTDNAEYEQEVAAEI